MIHTFLPFIWSINFFISEIFLIFFITFLLIYGVFYNTSNKYKTPILINNIIWFSSLTLFLTFLLITNNSNTTILIFNQLLIIDYLGNYSKQIIILSTLCCFFISINYIYLEKKKYAILNSFEYAILILTALLGMLLLISSYDLLTLYVAIELQSLSIYILVTYKRQSFFSVEAGLKYFILGAFSSCFFLLGSALIYGFIGTTNYYLIVILSSYNNEIIILLQNWAIFLGIFFILIAILFKLGAAPFHFWVPDVYEGSPTIVTSFIAIVPKLPLIIVLIRLFTIFSTYLTYWQPLLVIISISSILIGSFGALYQIKLKRILAYSSIGHIGFLLMGFCAGTINGLKASLIYIIVYIITSLSIFSIILSLRKVILKPLMSLELIDLINIIKQKSTLFQCFTLAILSMAGIPPLAGFISKIYLFIACLESNLYLLCLISILCSVLSTVYYIRLIKIIFFETEKNIVLFEPVNEKNSYIISFISFFFFLFIWYLDLIIYIPLN